MPDPTETFLTLCFAFALLTAAGFIGWRARHPAPPSLGKVPVGFYRGYDLVGALLVFSIYSTLAILTLHAPKGLRDEITVSTLITNIGFQLFLALVVSIFALQHAKIVEWLGLKWRGWRHGLWIAPTAVGLVWAVVSGLEAAGYFRWMESMGIEPLQDAVAILQHSDDPRIIGLMIVTAVIVAPICEEIVFRGYVYPVLKRFSGAVPAAFLSALIFGAAHGNLAILLPLSLLGILLVWIYEKTGSIWAPIAVHFCFNAATVALQLAARAHFIPLPDSP